MNATDKSLRQSTDEQTVLVLQGGGALGAYQAGVYEELAVQGLAPDWVAGISIGAINAALIAGNPPERRVERLRTFWDLVSSKLPGEPPFPGEQARSWFNQGSAALGATLGIPGFFQPRIPPAVGYPPGAKQALSIYDTAPLRETLESLVDFDLINAGRTRLSVGAVNIRLGNFVYFDNQSMAIGPEHIMASGALPPGLPPVEIDGEQYWDGGLVSNTPLQYVLDVVPRQDSLVFQVDLFSARGDLPRDLSEDAEREKDIRFSSRTRMNTDIVRLEQSVRRAVHRLLSKLPKELENDADVQFLHRLKCNAAISIVHLIYRRKNYHCQSKDFDFSRFSLREHWQAGQDDVRRTLRHRDWRQRLKPTTSVSVFDLADDRAG